MSSSDVPPYPGDNPPHESQEPPEQQSAYGPPPPQQAGGPPKYGGPPQYAAGPPPQNQKALWAMITGILSLVCCGFFAGVPAIILGRMGMQEIDRSGQQQTGRGMAQAGFIMGIVGTALSAILVLLWIVITLSALSAGNEYAY